MVLKQKIRVRAETETEMWTGAVRHACKFVTGEIQKRCFGETKRWLADYITSDCRKIAAGMRTQKGGIWNVRRRQT
jgi:hypothetical protein